MPTALISNEQFLQIDLLQAIVSMYDIMINVFGVNRSACPFLSFLQHALSSFTMTVIYKRYQHLQ